MPPAPGWTGGTWPWAGSSDSMRSPTLLNRNSNPSRGRRSGPAARAGWNHAAGSRAGWKARGRLPLPAGVACCLVLLAAGLPAQAAVMITQEEALELAFPEADVERRTAYLDESQMEQIRRLAGPGVPVTSALVPHYVASRGGQPVGVAYFDTHRVRTEAATVMVLVDPDGQLSRLEMIAFDEPPDYLPRPAWLEQFRERSLDANLALRKRIRPMTGATLTARSLTAAARRALALHAVIDPFVKQENR